MPVIVSAPLLYHVRTALQLNQRQLGELLGVATRTIQRWGDRQSGPASFHWEKLAVALHPHDPALAARAASAGGTTLEALGLHSAAPAAAPAYVVSTSPEYVVDALVCVAAEAAEMMPRAIRPALLAAFTRARQLGLSVDAVEKALEGKPPSASAKGKK